MKLRFLVLLAIVGLLAHTTSAHEAKAQPEKEVKAQPEKEVRAKPEGEAKPERRIIETDDEITEIIHHSHKKEAKPKKITKKIIKEVVVHKKDPKPKAPVKTCEEITAQNKTDCETKDIPEGYKPIFSVVEVGSQCDWKCDYEALPTTPAPVIAPVTKKVKVTKHRKVKKPAKNLKECSGEKKITFSNCLVKVNGLIAWGAKTKNFEKKWEKFLADAKKPKKSAKKAKPAKKPARPAETPAQKPAN